MEATAFQQQQQQQWHRLERRSWDVEEIFAEHLNDLFKHMCNRNIL